MATAFRFRLQPAGIVLGGAVIYQATVDVLRGWADYVTQAPDELTSMVFLMSAPPAPFIPPDQVGKLVAIIGVVHVGDVQSGQRVVAPLRRLGALVADITRPMPYPGIFALTAEATTPSLHAIRSGFMRELDDDVLAAIVEHTAHVPVPGGLVQLRGLGGAMARVPTEATAFAHRDKRYMVATW